MIVDTKAALAAHARQPQGRVRLMMDDDEDGRCPRRLRRRLTASDTANRLLKVLQASPVSMTAIDVARATGVHVVTSYRCLRELVDAGQAVVTGHRRPKRGKPAPCYAAKS